MKFKQGLFLSGIVFQVAILSVTFYFLQEMKQEPITIQEDDLVMEKGVQIPFAHYVLGEGKVACSQYVKVHARREGIIDQMPVGEGDLITLGQSLFQVDDGMLRCAFREKMAEYEKALAEVKFLEKEPSEFDLRAKEKEIDQVQLRLAQEEKEQAIYIDLFEKCAISLAKKERQDTTVHIAAAELDKVISEYMKIKAGPSAEEKEVKRAALKEKEMGMRSAEKALSDCHVLAPLEGRVLKVHAHSGEYIRAGDEALLIGSEHPLHLRVLIDEKEMWRVTPSKSLRALAIHRMNPNIHFIPNFVTLKQSEHEGKLEIVFTFDKGNAPIYLDQRLDVYIEAASPQDTAYLDYQFKQNQP